MTTETLSVEQIVNSLDALTAIADENLPIKTAITISKTIKEVNEILNVFNDKKKKLFDKYGEENKEAEGMVIKSENIEEFNVQYTDLIKEEIDVDFTKVSVDDLGDINVKPSTLIVLEWFINA